ncbi:amino acid permease/ SLC12A domain-containing protein [Mucor mucedo]|uniref:amino acid permease/ SLC12A domain-containing protein n=1 Tax=Mucor mucedo TaxID=29922 RepID=UPI00222126B1|nr:amino acid permease/ SLC12A domain-containing protein [Mucor mucedo]KAI7896260.1 amino acid permease/ SLC12A domain-containing protein [Mucor mucedo]
MPTPDQKISRAEQGVIDNNPNNPMRVFNNEKVEVYDQTDLSFESIPNDKESIASAQPIRGLSARHIQMISLGGCIGTGLFLNSGQNIAIAGPAGALIAYIVVGVMVYCLMTSLGEMATYLPVSGSFNHYAFRFIDPAFGFAIGWNYWLSAVTIATEISASATIINWWKPVLPDPAWSTIFIILIILINLVGVQLFGELEYWFALLKILIVLVFIIIALCVTTGGLGERVIGFDYWKNPGAFAGAGLGTLDVLLSAGFSFMGTEVVGITAAEAKNPTKTVPRAIRNTFWRIIFFYILTIFLLGMCLPFDNPDLANPDGDPGTASFTLVFTLAGIEAGAHVINAVILISVLSAANSSLYTCSRTMLGLAKDGNAPRFLAKMNRFGSPYWAVLCSSIVGFLCVFASIYSASVAFVWFLSITAVSGFIGWWGIAVVHIRFRQAFVAQGRSMDDLPFKAFGYPYSAYIAIALTTFVIFGQGYNAFYPEFNGTKFVQNYIGLVPVTVWYIGYKLIRKSKVIPLMDVDFETGRVTRLDIEQDDAEDKVLPWYRKVLAWIV